VDFLTQVSGRFGSASDLPLGIARFGSQQGFFFSFSGFM
jgi:hypothetical protein